MKPTPTQVDNLDSYSIFNNLMLKNSEISKSKKVKIEHKRKKSKVDKKSSKSKEKNKKKNNSKEEDKLSRCRRSIPLVSPTFEPCEHVNINTDDFNKTMNITGTFARQNETDKPSCSITSR